MNKKGELNIGMIFLIFIGIIVAVAILGEIATQQGVATTKSNVINESTDISASWYNGTVTGYNSTITVPAVTDAPSDWKTTKCPLTGFVFANATQIFTVTTDYTVSASTGVITLVPTDVINGSGNTTYASYTHCRDGYNVDGGARSIAGLWVLFAALALVAFVAIGLKDRF